MRSDWNFYLDHLLAIEEKCPMEPLIQCRSHVYWTCAKRYQDSWLLSMTMLDMQNCWGVCAWIKLFLSVYSGFIHDHSVHYHPIPQHSIMSIHKVANFNEIKVLFVSKCVLFSLSLSSHLILFWSELVQSSCFILFCPMCCYCFGLIDLFCIVVFCFCPILKSDKFFKTAKNAQKMDYLKPKLSLHFICVIQLYSLSTNLSQHSHPVLQPGHPCCPKLLNGRKSSC